MEHNDIRHKLSEYLDGSATGEERAAIDTHLTTCAECAEALSELRKTIEHIKSIEELEPPAWMKRKIMAKVRAEAETKKGFFERFFLPLSIKLPIQAVSVVFIAVTAFYIYRSIQPATSPTESPMQEFAAEKEAAKDKLSKSEDLSLRTKKVAQAPEDKSLDMKQEYEKPATPQLAGKADIPAPVPASPARYPAAHERNISEGQADSMSLNSRADAEREESAYAAGSAARGPKPEGAMRVVKAKAALSEGSAEYMLSLTMTVKELDTAAKEIEKTVTAFGGKIIRTSPVADGSAIIISINRDRYPDFLTKLKMTGNLKEKAPVPIRGEGLLTIIRITLTIK